ncbi:MAG TPA: hypothetical protein VF765_30815 [Polyangiaceae bacterium]
MHRWLLLLAVCLLLACGGKGANAGGENKLDLDSDPLALLPGSAVVVANVDARSLRDSTTVGPQLGAIADRLVPLGDDAGFQASRDVDRVVLASYATGGIDVAAVVSGRFDPAKLDAATKTKSGAAITTTMYAGRATHAAGGGVWCVLTEKTVVAGTSEAVRHVLDKLKTGKIERAEPPWVIETLQTPGAELAVAGDFASQPLVAASIGAVRLPWLEGLHTARIIGNFQKPGMNVAATLSYGDAQQASSAADGVRTVTGWIKLLGPFLGGLSLQNLDVQTAGTDMQCKFAVDDQTLSNILALAPRFLPAPQ